MTHFVPVVMVRVGQEWTTIEVNYCVHTNMNMALFELINVLVLDELLSYPRFVRCLEYSNHAGFEESKTDNEPDLIFDMDPNIIQDAENINDAFVDHIHGCVNGIYPRLLRYCVMFGVDFGSKWNIQMRRANIQLL